MIGYIFDSESLIVIQMYFSSLHHSSTIETGLTTSVFQPCENSYFGTLTLKPADEQVTHPVVTHNDGFFLFPSYILCSPRRSNVPAVIKLPKSESPLPLCIVWGTHLHETSWQIIPQLFGVIWLNGGCCYSSAHAAWPSSLRENKRWKASPMDKRAKPLWCTDICSEGGNQNDAG